MTTIHKEIAKRLEGKLTSEECGQLLQDVQAELVRLAPRMGALHPGGGMHARGEERRRALLSGTPDELLNLRDEFDKLQAEHDQLAAQRDELSGRRTQARIQEAFDGLPALHGELGAKITAAEAAHQALEAAFDDMDAAYLTVSRARGQCNFGALPAVGTDAETIKRLMRLAPFSAKGRISTQEDAGRHRENLGYDHLAQPIRWQA